MSGVELVIGLGAITLVVVFAVAFRYGLRQSADTQHDVPRAVLVAGDARWMSGQGRQRWLGRVPTFQAALVAVAITSVFVMGACLLAIVGVVAFGR